MSSHHHRTAEEKKRRKRNRKVKAVISYILTFLLSVFLFALLGLIGINIGIFNENIIFQKLNETNYYENIKTTIEDNIEAILLPSGIPSSVMNDVIKLDKVYLNSKTTIENLFAGKETTIDTTEMKSTFRKNLEEYMEENNITQFEDQGIEILAEEISKQYKSAMQFSFVKYFVKYKEMYQKVIKILIPILIVLILIMIIILFVMQKYKHKSLRYIAYADTATGLMLIIAPSILLISEFYKKINISPQYFYNFLVEYIKWDIQIFVYLGVACLGVLILLIPIIAKLRKKAN